MNFLLSYLLSRLKEPSTYAGVGVLGAALGIGPMLMGPIAQIIMGGGGLIAMLISEKHGVTPPPGA
jgi:hypothetical protein